MKNITPHVCMDNAIFESQTNPIRLINCEKIDKVQINS